MNLCYICHEYPPLVRNFGGIGVILQFEAEWFARQGHSVRVVCQTMERPAGAYRHNNVTIEVLNPSRVPRVGAIWNRSRVAGGVRKALGRNPGVVICTDYGGLLLAKPSAHPLAVHLQGCASLHAVQQGHTVDRKTRFFERRTVKCADGIRAASAFASQLTLRILNLSDRSPMVIPNPVDTDFFTPEPAAVNQNEILFVGKLCKLKGIPVLGQAIGGVFERVPQARLVMVGHDIAVDSKSTKALFLELVSTKHHSRIEFIDRMAREDVARRMRRTGVLVLPSYAETFPLVVLEAMASGRPVVASNLGGIPEAIEDGRNGLLADPSRPVSFTEAILELILQPARASSLGQAGRRLAEIKFSPVTVFSQLRDFYEELAKRGGPDFKSVLSTSN